MFPTGLAAQGGTILKGDKVLSINGQMVHNVTHADATTALRQARNPTLAVIVIDRRSVEGETESGGCRTEELSPAGKS